LGFVACQHDDVKARTGASAWQPQKAASCRNAATPNSSSPSRMARALILARHTCGTFFRFFLYKKSGNRAQRAFGGCG